MKLHLDIADDALPDLGTVCCMGVAVYGPGRCTCWEPVYDLEQATLRRELEPKTRERMCGDCAFRNDSPERAGDERYAHSGEGDLEDLVHSREAFACHEGMRRRVALVHPTGVRVECPPPGYDPPIATDGRGELVAFKADGTPAEMCAGLCAARRLLERP